ncbi:unnamed protein product [Amoebophrya sp. A25]|nr:unnamed protein product [Amoebophrya sp. A25]|eukprot:GSA25T00007293001.1
MRMTGTNRNLRPYHWPRYWRTTFSKCICTSTSLRLVFNFLKLSKIVSNEQSITMSQSTTTEFSDTLQPLLSSGVAPGARLRQKRFEAASAARWEKRRQMGKTTSAKSEKMKSTKTPVAGVKRKTGRVAANKACASSCASKASSKDAEDVGEMEIIGNKSSVDGKTKNGDVPVEHQLDSCSNTTSREGSPPGTHFYAHRMDADVLSAPVVDKTEEPAHTTSQEGPAPASPEWKTSVSSSQETTRALDEANPLVQQETVSDVSVPALAPTPSEVDSEKTSNNDDDKSKTSSAACAPVAARPSSTTSGFKRPKWSKSAYLKKPVVAELEKDIEDTAACASVGVGRSKTFTTPEKVTGPHSSLSKTSITSTASTTCPADSVMSSSTGLLTSGLGKAEVPEGDHNAQTSPILPKRVALRPTPLVPRNLGPLLDAEIGLPFSAEGEEIGLPVAPEAVERITSVAKLEDGGGESENDTLLVKRDVDDGVWVSENAQLVTGESPKLSLEADHTEGAATSTAIAATIDARKHLKDEKHSEGTTSTMRKSMGASKKPSSTAKVNQGRARTTSSTASSAKARLSSQTNEVQMPRGKRTSLPTPSIKKPATSSTPVVVESKTSEARTTTSSTTSTTTTKRTTPSKRSSRSLKMTVPAPRPPSSSTSGPPSSSATPSKLRTPGFSRVVPFVRSLPEGAAQVSNSVHRFHRIGTVASMSKHRGVRFSCVCGKSGCEDPRCAAALEIAGLEKERHAGVVTDLKKVVCEHSPMCVPVEQEEEEREVLAERNNSTRTEVSEIILQQESESTSLEIAGLEIAAALEIAGLEKERVDDICLVDQRVENLMETTASDTFVSSHETRTVEGVTVKEATAVEGVTPVETTTAKSPSTLPHAATSTNYSDTSLRLNGTPASASSSGLLTTTPPAHPMLNPNTTSTTTTPGEGACSDFSVLTFPAPPPPWDDSTNVRFGAERFRDQNRAAELRLLLELREERRQRVLGAGRGQSLADVLSGIDSAVAAGAVDQGDKGKKMIEPKAKTIGMGKSKIRTTSDLSSSDGIMSFKQRPAARVSRMRSTCSQQKSVTPNTKNNKMKSKFNRSAAEKEVGPLQERCTSCASTTSTSKSAMLSTQNRTSLTNTRTTTPKPNISISKSTTSTNNKIKNSLTQMKKARQEHDQPPRSILKSKIIIKNTDDISRDDAQNDEQQDPLELRLPHPGELCRDGDESSSDGSCLSSPFTHYSEDAHDTARVLEAEAAAHLLVEGVFTRPPVLEEEDYECNGGEASGSQCRSRCTRWRAQLLFDTAAPAAIVSAALKRCSLGSTRIIALSGGGASWNKSHPSSKGVIAFLRMFLVQTFYLCMLLMMLVLAVDLGGLEQELGGGGWP